MLTEEQKQRIEQNRLAAIRRKEELARQRAQSNGLPSNQPNRNTTASNPNATVSNPKPTNNSTTSNGVHRPPQPNPTNSNGIHAQPQLGATNSASTAQSKYTFNRINANAVLNRPNSNPPNPPLNRQQPNHPTASYGSNTAAASFAIPSANRPANQNQGNPPNGNQNSNYITPAKRPAGPNDHQVDKRLKTGAQAKSPYEQIMGKVQTVKIEFSLLSNREFYVDFKYNQKLVDEVRRLKSARFDGAQKKWAFKLEHYEEIMSALPKIKLDRLTVQLGEGFPKDVLDLLEDSLKYNQIKVNLEANRNVKVILNRLFPYQKEGVMFGVRREGEHSFPAVKSQSF